MLDQTVVHIFFIIGFTYLVYRLKNGNYEICSYIDKPTVNIVVLSSVIFLSQSYIVLAIVILFGYVLVMDECYIKKWEDAFATINVSDRSIQRCKIKEMEPVYSVPHIDPSVREGHREAFVGREYFSTN